MPAQSTFSARIVCWQRQYGRHQLPWQTDDPYRVWLSEIMLQQTQVSTVLDYYPRFVAQYPDVQALAKAPLDDVLSLWSGLGYYSRARNLHHAAIQVVEQYGGAFPCTRTDLETLKGIGRSTAAAIAVFAFGRKEAILDGNVKRVLARHAGIEGLATNKATLEKMWQEAEQRLPESPNDLRSYTQGLMDLGSLICTRSKPDCSTCPVADDCYAQQHDCIAALPTRKQRSKPLPEKSTILLLLQSQYGIHLYRRPDHGIWRNLWSLPEFDSEKTALAFARQHGTVVAQASGKTFTHRFTHYALHISPMYLQLKNADPALGWFSTHEALGKGLPKPIRSIIEQYQHANG